MSITIKGYTLVNEEKANRAIFGSVGKNGLLFGGVGEEATDEAKLAAYDRLGGLILKGKHKVKTGTFYDFSKQRPHDKPKVMLEFRDLRGTIVYLEEGAEVPLEVRAAQLAQEVADKERAAKAEKEETKKTSKKKKKQDDDFEDEVVE